MANIQFNSAAFSPFDPECRLLFSVTLEILDKIEAEPGFIGFNCRFAPRDDGFFADITWLGEKFPLLVQRKNESGVRILDGSIYGGPTSNFWNIFPRFLARAKRINDDRKIKAGAMSRTVERLMNSVPLPLDDLTPAAIRKRTPLIHASRGWVTFFGPRATDLESESQAYTNGYEGDGSVERPFAQKRRGLESPYLSVIRLWLWARQFVSDDGPVFIEAAAYTFQVTKSGVIAEDKTPTQLLFL